MAGSGSPGGSYASSSCSGSCSAIGRIARRALIVAMGWGRAGGMAAVTVSGGDVVQRMVLALQGRRQVHTEGRRWGRGRGRGRQRGRQVVAGAAACGSRTRKRRTEHTTARRAGRKSAQRNRFLFFVFLFLICSFCFFL